MTRQWLLAAVPWFAVISGWTFSMPSARALVEGAESLMQTTDRLAIISRDVLLIRKETQEQLSVTAKALERAEVTAARWREQVRAAHAEPCDPRLCDARLREAELLRGRRIRDMLALAEMAQERAVVEERNARKAKKLLAAAERQRDDAERRLNVLRRELEAAERAVDELRKRIASIASDETEP